MTKPNDLVNSYGNLTKREYFAALAMQGDIADGIYTVDISERAVLWLQCADALIAELNKC